MSDHPLRTLETVVLVAIGGFAGSSLRYLVARILPGTSGTLLVNVVGSFALGFLLYEALYSNIVTERARLLLTTGFLSSLTTYSTFALQTVLLDTPIWMLANVLVTYVLGFSGVLAGRALARRVDGGGR